MLFSTSSKLALALAMTTLRHWLFLLFAMLLCVADVDDCKYWTCHDHQSNTDFAEYRNCSLTDPNWDHGDIFGCTFCEIHDVGVCWCASEAECRATTMLIMGCACLVLSVLCGAIVWYQYLHTLRRFKATERQLLQQQAKRRRRSSKRSRKCQRAASVTSSTFLSFAEGNVQSEDADIEGTSSRKMSPRNSETLSSVDLRAMNGNLLSMQHHLNAIKTCNARCVAVWTVTAICAAVFVFGGATLFYEFIE